MKIGLAQTNPIIGDFAINCRKILARAEEAVARGCTLVIFPEMALTGYPPQDLLEQESFLDAQGKALGQLVAALPAIDVLFGCIERRQGGSGKRLYNSAFGVRDGKIVYRARKRLLPAYDVFDETRYFEPGAASELYRVGGCCFAVTVCEDIWRHEIGEYGGDPVEEMFALARRNGRTVDGVINISASPFQKGKEEMRRALFRSLCRRYRVPLLYVNQVGGQDSLLFDGRSRVVNKNGELAARGAGFAESLTVVDTETWQGEMRDELREDDAAIYAALVMGVRDYVEKCGFSSVLLGLSGGIDSALTAAIAVDALGAERVLGVALPSPYSSEDSLEDAEKLAENLGCRLEVIPINALFASFRETLAPLFSGRDEDVTEQNIQARIRGNLLMALSNKFGGLLLTTGNKSEMAVGYCTLYGDMSGGLAVISDVPKQLVYALAHHVNRHGEVIPARTIRKAPTAELRPRQCDQDDLPPYDVLDRILELHLEKGEGLQEIVDRGIEEATVRDVLRRVQINEYKRKQAPMGLKVTGKAFGYGRRFPNAQNFRE